MNLSNLSPGVELNLKGTLSWNAYTMGIILTRFKNRSWPRKYISFPGKATTQECPNKGSKYEKKGMDVF